MTIIGEGDYQYEISGDDWGDLPEGWSYKEATSVAVDPNDNVYVFNRGEHPVIVFDRDGAMINSWGEGIFTSAHGVAVGPDESLYCIDAADHTVRKFTFDGKLLMTIGRRVADRAGSAANRSAIRPTPPSTRTPAISSSPTGTATPSSTSIRPTACICFRGDDPAPTRASSTPSTT